VPSDRTFITEIATALGMVGDSDLDEVLARRPHEFVNLAESEWDRLVELRLDGAYGPEFLGSFLNGQAFLESPSALRGRRPRLIEWTGGRRPPGDEVVPADLRIDHVYLVSCKYLSRILHNPSPARLAIGLLSHDPVDDAQDWFQRTAPEEYQELYNSCRVALGASVLPSVVGDLTSAQRRVLASQLRNSWPHEGAGIYEAMCSRVAEQTANEWRRRLTNRNRDVVLWRLLRIGATPYFMLGTSADGPTRMRIDTAWDWRQRFVLHRFDISPQTGGQARVGWRVDFYDRLTGGEGTVGGHVEIRWSHGRFGQPPEAKVYLDSPLASVPGYHEI
jgi:hypothetical protein